MHNKLKLIGKWIRMLSGRSILHMRQSAGLYYDNNAIKGYYSDLRHKVTVNTLLDNAGIPINITNKGSIVHFAIAIFQYGLGAYDLYLETNDDKYLKMFYKAVAWAVERQEESGAWDAFGWCNPDAKYSSMAQGEGASLLVRAYLESRNTKYLADAKKAIDFMIIPVDEGGTTIYYLDGGLTFEEAKENRTIFNGVIFSIWGLRDFCVVSKEEKYRDLLKTAVNYLCNNLSLFDRKYWSNYDLDGNIASPFYHDLHIEQLKVMYDLFGNDEFRLYKEKWLKYQNSFIKSKRAFVIKSIQKLRVIDNEIDLVK